MRAWRVPVAGTVLLAAGASLALWSPTPEAVGEAPAPTIRTQSAAASEERALPRLSDYGFFVGDLAELRPATRVYPYALNTPLFSDYAEKTRFVVLPEGAVMTWDDTEVFGLPVGTYLVKTFSYPVDERDPSLGRRHVETRLLKHAPEGWVAWGYRWADDQSDAAYEPLGGEAPVRWIDDDGRERTLAYEVPNQFQCKGCHSFEGEIRPIGPTARQLHGGAVDYAADWVEAGLLAGAPADRSLWPIMDWRAAGASVEARARAYLDANCGYCHRPEGPGGSSGLFLHHRYPTGAQTGVRKAPVAAGKGSGGLTFGIHPGKPGKSILVHRLASADPAVRMPEVGRTVVHEEGLALVRAWIADME